MMKRSSSTSRDLFLRVALFALLIVSSLAATTRSRGRKKVAKEVKEAKEMDICENQNRQAPIVCYCDSKPIRNATVLDCYVLNVFKIDDPMWTYIGSQIQLTKFKFAVRGPYNLDYLPINVLRQLKNLKVISYQDAKIEKLANNTFSNFSSVTEIDLSKDMIVVLGAYAFENMRELTVINLDQNRITEINRNVFVNLPKLKTLYLNKNNITTVHDKAFKHLPNLQELQLSGNQIGVITRESFNGLRNLKRLDLRTNFISMIGDRNFVEMPELIELELDQNSISYISEKAFDGLRNLKKLHLGANQLVSLGPDFLSGAPGIYFLDLRNNNLKTMTFNNVKPIVTNLYNSTSYFYLEGNNLICDCNLAWIWGLMNETKNNKLRDALEELTCFLETNNTALKINNEDLERNQELGIARNPGAYLADNLKNGNGEDEDRYLGDLADASYEYSDEDYENPTSKMQTVESKACCVKHLFDLKLEELPCPDTTREDLMASEQPSSRHENAPVGSSGSIWFTSSTRAHRVDRYLLASSLLLLQLLPSISSLIFT